MIKLITVVLTLVLIGCASQQPGEFAKVIEGDHPQNTPLTAYVDETYSTDKFMFINITFGNQNEQWTRVKAARIYFSDELDRTTSIIVGQDLMSWAEAMTHKVQVDQHNRNVWLGSAVAALAATSVVASSNGNNNLALGTLGAVSGIVTIDAINKTIKKAEAIQRASLVPDGHLYSGPFSIPPGLVTTRWVLLQIPSKGNVCKANFEVEYLDNKSAKYEVVFGGRSNCINPKRI